MSTTVDAGTPTELSSSLKIRSTSWFKAPKGVRFMFLDFRPAHANFRGDGELKPWLRANCIRRARELALTPVDVSAARFGVSESATLIDALLGYGKYPGVVRYEREERTVLVPLGLPEPVYQLFKSAGGQPVTRMIIAPAWLIKEGDERMLQGVGCTLWAIASGGESSRSCNNIVYQNDCHSAVVDMIKLAVARQQETAIVKHVIYCDPRLLSRLPDCVSEAERCRVEKLAYDLLALSRQERRSRIDGLDSNTKSLVLRRLRKTALAVELESRLWGREFFAAVPGSHIRSPFARRD